MENILKSIDAEIARLQQARGLLVKAWHGTEESSEEDSEEGRKEENTYARGQSKYCSRPQGTMGRSEEGKQVRGDTG